MSKEARLACTEIAILLVDDDFTFRGALAEMLRDDGHPVQAYGAPREVPDLDRLGPVQLVITDYDMPGKSGLAFADEFHAAQPEAPILLVTAYSTQAIQTQLGTRPFVSLFIKPVDYEALHTRIHERAASSGPAAR